MPDIEPLVARRGLRVIREIEDRESFGNAQIVMGGQELEMRVTRDRGIVSVDLRAQDGCTWWGLKLLMGYMTSDQQWESLEQLSKRDEATVLDEAWDALRTLLTDKAVEPKLAAFSRERTLRILKRMSGK